MKKYRHGHGEEVSRSSMVKVAVVGSGYWGRNHVRTLVALRQEGLIEEVIVCDLDAQRAEEIGTQFDCSWVTDVDALSEMGVCAATIATPTPSHAALGIRLMESGIDVMIEKPLAMNHEEAEQVLAVAESTGRLLLVGHVFRHHAGVREAARIIAEGRIGPVRQIITERMSSREPRPDNGVIAALGIHDLDICCDLLGDAEPQSITGLACESSIKGIEDHASLQMQFPDVDGQQGPAAFITLSWRSRVRGKVRDLQIIGRDGSIGVDYLDHGGIWLHTHPGDAHGPEFGGFDAAPRERIEIPLGEPALTAELRDFVLRSTGQRNTPPLNDGKVGLQGMLRVEQALRATGFEAQLNQ